MILRSIQHIRGIINHRKDNLNLLPFDSLVVDDPIYLLYVLVFHNLLHLVQVLYTISEQLSSHREIYDKIDEKLIN